MMETVGVVIVQNGWYVAQLRDELPHIADPGMISTWGGAVEAGETPAQAAVRELKEETGVEADESQLIYLTEFVTDGRSQKTRGKKVRFYQYALELGDNVDIQCFEGKRLVRMKASDYSIKTHTDLLMKAIRLI